MQFTILHCNLAKLSEEFTKLNKKCEKYGNELLSFETVDEPFLEKDDDRLWQVIEVSGCTPVIGEYKLVGVLSKLDDNSNSIQNVPGEELPVEFRSSDFTRCDHCNTKRYRKEVVVVQNLNNQEYLQLGKTCVKDYLGIKLDHLINKFTWVYDLCEEARGNEFCGSSQEYTVEPSRYLIYVSLCCRKLGWVSSKEAYENGYNPTKSIAFDVMFPSTPYIQRFIKENDLYIASEDKDIAEKALEWAKNLEGKSDFEYNVKSIASQEIVRYKHLGYLAAIIPCYRKSIEKEIVKQARKPSEWCGEIKQRLELTLKCIFVKEFDTQFGVSTMFKFVDADDNVFVWFASNDPGINQGETYTLKGTVKKHDEYNGTKQTILTRCNLAKKKEKL